MKIIRFLLISSLLVSMSGCNLLSKEKTALKPPLVQPIKQDFVLAEVKRGTISREFRSYAQFESSKKQNFYFKSSGGRLQSINVGMGDTVKKGDVLAQLDAGDYENQVFVQKRMLEKATIAYQQIQLLRPNDEVALQLQKIDVELARNELNRLSDLLNKTKLIATIDGEVSYVSELKEGDYITAYNTVVSISDPKQVVLVVRVPDPNDIKDIRVGMTVNINAALTEYHGHVLQAPSSVPATVAPNELATNQTKLIMGIDDLLDQRYIGLGSEFAITLEKKDDTLIIPKDALSTFLDRQYVHIQDGKTRKEVDVEVGTRTNDEVEIIKGLSEGQKVIVN
jgi:RND family efflux transporter MFP subunit